MYRLMAEFVLLCHVPICCHFHYFNDCWVIFNARRISCGHKVSYFTEENVFHYVDETSLGKEVLVENLPATCCIIVCGKLSHKL